MAWYLLLLNTLSPVYLLSSEQTLHLPERIIQRHHRLVEADCFLLYGGHLKEKSYSSFEKMKTKFPEKFKTNKLCCSSTTLILEILYTKWKHIMHSYILSQSFNAWNGNNETNNTSWHYIRWRMCMFHRNVALNIKIYALWINEVMMLDQWCH